MKRGAILLGFMIVACVPFFVGASSESVGPTAPSADAYRVDSVHSTMVFRIKHYDVAPFYGRFTVVRGSFSIDPETPSNSFFKIDVDTRTVDTANPARDTHIKGPDLLNVRQFPKITFVSTAVEKVGENQYKVTGDITFHGVTKSITAQVEHTGTGTIQGRKASGFEAIFTIKRSDFGVNFMIGAGLSDEVKLMLGVEGLGA